MDQKQLQNDISIIKKMIEKTRTETAESGHLFIIIGIVWLIIPVILFLMERYQIKNYWWPVFIFAMLITMIIAILIGIRENKRTVPATYTKKIFSQLWLACGTVCILTGFIFPLLGVYPVHYRSFITWPVIAIGIYLSGVIYEIAIIRLLSFTWIAGSILMAVVTVPVHLYISVVTMFFGFVLPGIMFSRQYKKRSI